VYVEVDLTAAVPSPCLREPDDLRRLKVVIRGAPDPAAAAEALASIGELESREQARLRVDALLELAHPHSAARSWRQSFDDMLAYAGANGWLDESGDTIEAHCEWR
jgi:hypothetical protein